MKRTDIIICYIDVITVIDPPRKLTGDGYLFYDNSNQLIPNVHFGTKWYNGISFRTRVQNGTLMFISADDGETVHIEVNCLTFILREPKVISLCHQYITRPACTSVQSDQVLYCWLTNFKSSF